MYTIEHKGEKQAKGEHHKGIDETKLHYHILVKFEPTHGATLQEIIKYIGVPWQIVEKLGQGKHSYDGMLVYLIHIKYINLIQYNPEEVITLIGTDYKDHFTQYKKSWLRARTILAEKGGKPLNRLLREAMTKMEAGKIAYSELRGIKEYRKLLFDPKYARQLEQKSQCIVNVAKQDYDALADKIKKEEITSLDEIAANKDWILARKYQRVK